MSSITQGSFKIELRAKGTDKNPGTVLIGEGKSSNNQLTITITNNDTVPRNVRVTVSVKCGNTVEALLAEKTAKVSATYPTPNNPSASLQPGPSTPDSRSWQTSSRGVAVDVGKQLSIQLAGFESNTPPGNAVVDVLVQVNGSPKLDDRSVLRILEVAKVADGEPADSEIYYFTVGPDYILHAGQTPVEINFYATKFDSVVLFRNNQEVETWPSNEHPAAEDRSITGTFSDKPSITSDYRLEGRNSTSTTPGKKGTETLYRTVQVISPGWNQIALPQGYPARLFVTTDFSGSGMKRLYGIFIDGDGNAALYSSATGVDDWRLEPGDVPQEMAMSPGVSYKNKLWLIGGSCVDPRSPASEVWCYEVDNETNQGQWKKKPDFPMTARMGHACVVFPRQTNGKIVEELWVLGGFNNGEPFGDVWKLSDENGTSWTQLPASGAWPARYMHAAASFTPASDQPTEVWIYGGKAKKVSQLDMWSTKDGGLTWKQRGDILPQPGAPFGAALVTFNASQAATGQRLFLGGTFLEPAAAAKPNRTSSFIFEWQWSTEFWEARPVIDGWERFQGSRFYMQAIAFNSFLFVWSLHPDIDATSLPRLNILIS